MNIYWAHQHVSKEYFEILICKHLQLQVGIMAAHVIQIFSNSNGYPSQIFNLQRTELN